MLSAVPQGLVDRSEILASAHGGDPIVSRLSDKWEPLSQTQGIPSLSNLRVDIIGHIEISVDSFKDFNVNSIDLRCKGVMENDFQVRVEIFISGEVSRRVSAVQSDVFHSKMSCEV